MIPEQAVHKSAVKPACLDNAPFGSMWDDGLNVEAANAIRQRDVAKLAQLKLQGVNFNARNRNGESMLHLACRRGNIETVLFLIFEARVSLTVKDDMGRTVLHDVCWRPQPDVQLMDVLIRTMPPQMLLAKDSRGHTPFDYTRRGDWPFWNQYLSERRPLIEQRLSLILAVEGLVLLKTCQSDIGMNHGVAPNAPTLDAMETC